MTMATQHDAFQERLDRIVRGKTSNWTVPGEGIAKPGQEHKIAALNVHRKVVKKKNPLGPKPLIMLPLALILGIVVVLAGDWVTLTWLTADGPLGFDPVEAFGPEIGSLTAAAAMSAVLAFGLQLKGLRFWVHIAGFAFAALYTAEIVQFAPALFEAYFPGAWMADMLSAPNAFGL